MQQGVLSERTLTTLRAYFEQQNHHPSDDHWETLRDVAEMMERMANGTCEPKVFLSAIDCGIGKTQTVVHFARALGRVAGSSGRWHDRVRWQDRRSGSHGE